MENIHCDLRPNRIKYEGCFNLILQYIYGLLYTLIIHCQTHIIHDLYINMQPQRQSVRLTRSSLKKMTETGASKKKNQNSVVDSAGNF